MAKGNVPAAAGGHPQIGSTHKNGDRMFGIAGLYSRVLAGRGTPKLSSLYHSTVTEHVRSVRVGDQLRVEWDGAFWWASSEVGRVGRLSWSKGDRARGAAEPGGRSPFDFDDGTLHVQNVTVSPAGEVVDCGGFVVPDDHDPSDWPMTPMPDPAERELTITIGVPARTEEPAPTPEPRPSSWLRRLLRGGR
ncbi:hypothetical protein [Curtobacterium sp. MCPF17_018]|uniref:hypothetical protein n=1 Tax=Curtobacterium sp. MCPF17_018 TaxID=2175638 RepID=UPI0011B56FB0|nr:hypothetical protein [Curtobacterium sp. MCPF17_018]